MTQETGKTTAALRRAAPLALALVPHAASAQDAGSYQLPPSPTPSAAAAGPVADGAPPPRVISTAPAPTPAPVVILPTPTPAVRPSAAPRPRTVRPQPVPAPVRESPGIQPAPAPTLAAPPPAVAAPPPAPATLPAAPAPMDWAWPAALGAVLALAGAGWAWRRRAIVAEEAAPDFVRPIVPSAAPTPTPPAAVPTAPTPAQQALDLMLDGTRMSTTLINAVLAYRLIAANHGDTPLTDLAVRGDMISAHASRPSDEQLAGSNAPLLHRIPMLAPGESIALPGEIRLPLAAITPIRHGEARLFVPLVRFEVEGTGLRTRSAFLVGQEPDTAGLRLQPFRLDLGPRVYPRLGQRTLPVPTFA